MATFSSVQQQHVLQAIAEYDSLGEDQFLALYGFERSAAHTLVHEGGSYDAKAVLGVAHKAATGRLATPEEFAGDTAGALAILRRRGFQVTGPAAAAPAPRTGAAPRSAARTAGRSLGRTAAPRRVAASDRPSAICPSCFTALPTSGVCDTCG